MPGRTQQFKWLNWFRFQIQSMWGQHWLESTRLLLSFCFSAHQNALICMQHLNSDLECFSFNIFDQRPSTAEDEGPRPPTSAHHTASFSVKRETKQFERKEAFCYHWKPTTCETPMIFSLQNPESLHPWQGNGSCMVNAVFIYRDLIRPQKETGHLRYINCSSAMWVLEWMTWTGICNRFHTPWQGNELCW